MLDELFRTATHVPETLEKVAAGTGTSTKEPSPQSRQYGEKELPIEEHPIEL